MKTEDLLKPAVAWSGDTWAGRIDQCASMLFCHGYINQAQREKIAKKLEVECRAASALEAATAGETRAAGLDAKHDIAARSEAQGDAQ